MSIARTFLLFALAATSEAAVLYYSDYDLTRAQSVFLRLETSPGNVQEVTESAGVMSIQVDGGPTLDAFCADVFTGIAGSTSYNSTVFSTNSAPYTRVAWLIANVLPTIVSGSGTAQQQGAALQVAIWDVIHDSGDGLDAGLLQRSTLTDTSVAAYVAAPWSPTAGLNLYQNVFPGTSFQAQDLVSLSSAVPEPSTRTLLAALTLGALVFAGRKHYSL
jgi:Thioester domain